MTDSKTPSQMFLFLSLKSDTPCGEWCGPLRDPLWVPVAFWGSRSEARRGCRGEWTCLPADGMAHRLLWWHGQFSVHKMVLFFKVSGDTKQGLTKKSLQGFVASPEPNIGTATPQGAQLNNINTEGLAKRTTMGKGWIHDMYMLPIVAQIIRIEFGLTNRRVMVSTQTSNKWSPHDT